LGGSITSALVGGLFHGFEFLPLIIIEAIRESEEQVSEITQVETWGETLILTHQ